MKTLLQSLFIPFALSFIVGCSPYLYVSKSDGLGGNIIYFYSYGKFCGPGWPPVENEKKDLLDYWPPVDDMDAICYAHDYCYKLTSSDCKTCDTTFSRTIIDYALMMIEKRKMERTTWKQNREGKDIIWKRQHPWEDVVDGCLNDSADMLRAFNSKPWSKPCDGSSDNIDPELFKTIFGIPYSVVTASFSIPFRPWRSHADPGKCNVSSESNPTKIIILFQKNYNELVLKPWRNSEKTISIPLRME